RIETWAPPGLSRFLVVYDVRRILGVSDARFRQLDDLLRPERTPSGARGLRPGNSGGRCRRTSGQGVAPKTRPGSRMNANRWRRLRERVGWPIVVTGFVGGDGLEEAFLRAAEAGVIDLSPGKRTDVFVLHDADCPAPSGSPCTCEPEILR